MNINRQAQHSEGKAKMQRQRSRLWYRLLIELDVMDATERDAKLQYERVKRKNAELKESHVVSVTLVGEDPNLTEIGCGYCRTRMQIIVKKGEPEGAYLQELRWWVHRAQVRGRQPLDTAWEEPGTMKRRQE